MTIRLSTGLRNAMVGDVGMKNAFAKGVLYVYSGAQPTSADSAVQGTLLAKVTVDGGAFAFGSPDNGLSLDAAANGAVAKAAAENWKATATAAGTAGWFRLMGNTSDNLASSTTLARMDGSIGISGADLSLPAIDFVIGTPITVDQFSFTLPAA